MTAEEGVQPETRAFVGGMSPTEIEAIGDALIVAYFKLHPGILTDYIAFNADDVRRYIEQDIRDGVPMSDVAYDQGKSTVQMLLADGEDPREAFSYILKDKDGVQNSK